MSPVRRSALAALAVVTAAAHAAPPVAPVREITLSDATLASSEMSRMRLKYLASCALEAGTTLVNEHADVRREWPGGMGLAPGWERRPLTDAEQRWVSACILARTNYFGVPVMLSMRAAFETDAPGLQADAAERRAYPVEEATFFGNVFRPDGGAYVCGPNGTAARRAAIAAHRRLCALPLDQRLADGRRVTACGFVHVGACTPEAFTQGGTTYREGVTVFLPDVPASGVRP